MEHSHHEEPKKQSALFSYIAAGVLIAGFLTFINVMHSRSQCCKDKKCCTEQPGQTHGEEHGGGEHHEGH